MKLCRPVTEGTTPRASDVVAIRCAEHAHVPPMNLSADGGDSECGACAGAEIADRAVNSIVCDILDGYAARLTYCANLRAKLDSARVRLNMMQPGAGDFLTEDDQP